MRDRTALLTVAEAADHLRVSSRTVYRLIASGELRIVKVRSRTLVSERELDAFLAAAHRQR